MASLSVVILEQEVLFLAGSPVKKRCQRTHKAELLIQKKRTVRHDLKNILKKMVFGFINALRHKPCKRRKKRNTVIQFYIPKSKTKKQMEKCDKRQK